MGLRKAFIKSPDAQRERRGALRLPRWLVRRKAPGGEVVVDPLAGLQRITPWGPRPMTKRARRRYEKGLEAQAHPNRQERREQGRGKKGRPQMRAFIENRPPYVRPPMERTDLSRR